jgi:general secretion pathway protein H
VLVVVVLMVMVSTLLVSAALRGSNKDPAATAAQHFTDTIALMSENSLFRGELLALRLTETGWQPLGYHVGDAEFVPLLTPLSEQTLEDDVRLAWLVEQAERSDERVQIADIGASLISDEVVAGEKPTVPQVFFFPSGEVTPITVWLEHIGTDVSHELSIDSLGHVTLVGEQP